jgi:hypothetical protein
MREKIVKQRFALAFSVVAALASSSVALAGGTLAGEYKAKISSPPEFKATWVMKFAKSGTYTVAMDGHVIVRGTYSSSGSTITFRHETGEGACAKTGKYTWKKSGKTLKFTRMSDSTACAGRSGVLAHTFTQQR